MSAASGRAPSIGTLRPGDLVEVSGSLRSVTFHPSTERPVFEAELADDTGAITLVWMGRRRVPGVSPGRRLCVRGRLVAQDGRWAVYNPDYDLDER